MIGDSSIDILPFTPALYSAVKQFSQTVWSRPKSEEFFEWRYLKCPSQLGFLAMQNDECLAMIWAFKRPYKHDGQERDVLEILDWYCRPDLIGSGLGIRLMQTLMKRPEPLLNAGGSPDTQRLLPRLEWTGWTPLKEYFLPLTGQALSYHLQNKFHIPSAMSRLPLNLLTKAWCHPSQKWETPNERVVEMDKVGLEITALYRRTQTTEVIPLPRLEYVDWLMHCPAEMGQYIPLYFYAGKELCGWSFFRLYTTPAGREARIIEIFTDRESESVYGWILSETLKAMQAFSADIVWAGASLASLQKALSQSHFFSYAKLPVNVLAKSSWPSSAHVHLQNNTSDFGLLPYPLTEKENGTAGARQ